MSGIVQNNILRTSGSIAVAAAGLNWSSTILTALTNLTVTVQNVGGSNYYYINGVRQQTLNLLEGFTYKFDQSDSSNSGHPFRFSTTSGGTHSGGSEYTTGVTTSGTPGNAGAYTQIVVALDAPTLYYYCTNHNYMGGTANTVSQTVEAGKGYWIDTTSTTCTITLPSAASKGDQIVLIDYARTWGTNSIFINSNGLNYQGDPDTLTVEYTTSGQSINIVYSDATKGWIPLEDDVTALEPSKGTQKGLFSYGGNDSGYFSGRNLVSSSGVIASDVSGAGTARSNLAGTTYGLDKGIYAFGNPAGSGYTNISNLVSNSGVIAADTTGVGTARQGLAGAGYGGDGRALFAFGFIGPATGISNLVSSSGVVATDTSAVGTGRNYLGGANYGGDKAIFGYGRLNDGAVTGITNLANSSGVVGSDVSVVGTARKELAAASYGGDKALFVGGNTGSIVSLKNLVNNQGVVQADVAGVGAATRSYMGTMYGGDKAIFAYGYNASDNYVNKSNLVNNLGVMAADVTGVGTAREWSPAIGYSLSA